VLSGVLGIRQRCRLHPVHFVSCCQGAYSRLTNLESMDKHQEKRLLHSVRVACMVIVASGSDEVRLAIKLNCLAYLRSMLR
jgi:hypothetical protein